VAVKVRRDLPQQSQAQRRIVERGHAVPQGAQSVRLQVRRQPGPGFDRHRAGRGRRGIALGCQRQQVPDLATDHRLPPHNRRIQEALQVFAGRGPGARPAAAFELAQHDAQLARLAQLARQQREEIVQLAGQAGARVRRRADRLRPNARGGLEVRSLFGHEQLEQLADDARIGQHLAIAQAARQHPITGDVDLFERPLQRHPIGAAQRFAVKELVEGVTRKERIQRADECLRCVGELLGVMNVLG